MNDLKLKAKIVENGLNMGQVAEKLGINKATMSRKVNSVSEFTALEIAELTKILNLSPIEVMDIFFCSALTETQE